MGSRRRRRRLKRSESFLGIHFDFHAGPDCKRVGKNVTREMVRSIIKRVQPDYIQCDCKGHPGFSSYPTKVGHPVPGFVRDPLRIWRDVTAARGVALYMHYSGVQDHEAVRHHRSWARVGPNRRCDKKNTSVFGPYVDDLLLPQLKELADKYDVDGAWVDGECWSLEPDYGPQVLEAFHRAAHTRAVPRKTTDKRWLAFARFCREGFREYLRHYVDEMHAHDPRFQVASNWAFSSFMPEPVSADVDFLSGDFSPNDSVNSARLEARCLAGQGVPWDLMAWSFRWKPGETCHSTKSVAQLQQEAAVVLTLGGGFQVYFKQKRDGSIYDWQMDVMAEVARFCRERQPFSHRAEPVPQVALLYSGAAYYRMGPDLFRPWSGQLDAMKGILTCLLGLHYSVEITMEHHLAGRMDSYPIIIVPEWEYLEKEFKEELLAYVERGGNLLLIGPGAAAMFAKPLGAVFRRRAETSDQWLEFGGNLAAMKTVSRRASLRDGVQTVGRLFAENNVAGPSRPAASIAEYGEGRIAATYLNLGERFNHASTSVARDFLAALVRELFPAPIVCLEGSDAVDVTVTRIDGQLVVNLVNTAGPHADPTVAVFDRVPRTGPLDVRIRTAKRPERVILQPGTRHLPFRFADGAVQLTLPELDIHEIIVIEDASA
ncbi:MAG TPA: hypothetical protein VM238_15190 [Phycisphaerae bacterium]|nr:hypothetical protein [Phycisphaerae bacterium]